MGLTSVDIGSSDPHEYPLVDGLSTGPQGCGVIAWYQSLGSQLPWSSGGGI